MNAASSLVVICPRRTARIRSSLVSVSSHSGGRKSLVVGVPPGERDDVGFDPARPGPGASQGRGSVKAGQQALVEQNPMVLSEISEVTSALFGRVAPHQLDPGAADGGVVLLGGSRVAGGALDAVADQVHRCGGAVPAHGQPGQGDVLAVAEVPPGRRVL